MGRVRCLVCDIAEPCGVLGRTPEQCALCEFVHFVGFRVDLWLDEWLRASSSLVPLVAGFRAFGACVREARVARRVLALGVFRAWKAHVRLCVGLFHRSPSFLLLGRGQMIGSV